MLIKARYWVAVFPFGAPGRYTSFFFPFNHVTPHTGIQAHGRGDDPLTDPLFSFGLLYVPSTNSHTWWQSIALLWLFIQGNYAVSCLVAFGYDDIWLCIVLGFLLGAVWISRYWVTR